MSQTFDAFNSNIRSLRGRYWKRRLILVGVLLTVFLIVFLLLWNTFFEYVPPGQHLVIISKDGEPLTPNHVLAEPGQKGIQRTVYGEGWHFILPIIYETELKPNTDIPAGKVGIVTALGGKRPPAGRLLAEEGEQGIQRRILPPGSYRLNQYGYKVEIADAVEIEPGYVGVRRRLLGVDGKGRFAEKETEKGILREILQPGLYYINTKEYDVVPSEVGIFQSTFHYDKDPARDTAITFVSKGGFPISLDCTVEWEILPEDIPALVAQYGSRQAVERNVIDVQAHAIGRDKGIDYGVQDFLEGSLREKFQEDFTEELTRVCREKNVTVHSAFIRNIIIPEVYLKPIRDRQIAGETELTNKAKELTAEGVAEVEREQQTILQKESEVQAETARLVASIDREVENVTINNKAEIDKVKAKYEAEIATLDAERTRLLGAAEAEVTKLVETARGNLYQLKMDVFQNDGEAFLRYSLSENLNPRMILRLFHSGSGTFWTNLDNKSMNFMLPVGNGAAPANSTPQKQQPQQKKQ